MPVIHRVLHGDCISSIAYKYGFFPDTVWDDPANAELRRRRTDPNVLFPGDDVSIMDKRPSSVSVATDRVHVFRRRGVPERLKVQFLSGGDPIADEPYTITVDGKAVASGRTDSQGRITIPIVPDAASAHVFLGDNDEPFELALGHLAPIDLVIGVQMRLQNLGYYRGPLDGTMNAELEGALVQFQSAHGLEPDSEINDDTRRALLTAYGG